MARDGSDLAVLFKVKTPASRDPSPPHSIDEVQQLTRRIKLMRCTGTSRDYAVTVLLFLIPNEFEYVPFH